MIRRYPSLGRRIAAWVIGEIPVLIVGGEPGSGKSLFMGELVLRQRELAKLYPELQSPPALISYDRVHYLFLKRLAELGIGSANNFLPEGETHPEARKLITGILRDTLLFAILHLPKNVPIILEAPLVDRRGEDIVDDLSAMDFPMQVFIIHSPAMQYRILQQEKRQAREMSAPALAIRQIHEALLQQREITSRSRQAQENELRKSWERWLGSREGLVLSWDPADDEAGFVHLKEALKTSNILPNPLTPQVVTKYAVSLIEVALETMPNPKAFAAEVRKYRE
jgi:hypothetical protein